MNARFGHNLLVHVIGVGGPPFLAYIAYRLSTDRLVNGGLVARIGLVAVFAVLAISILVLYLSSGIRRYEITDSGLIILRPWSRQTVPWHDIKHIDWNETWHYAVIRGGSSVIAFTSTEFFPSILEFLEVIQERSGCTLTMR